jgi:hypothetical protein
MGECHLGGRYSQCVCVEFGAIELLGVMEEGGNAALAHVFADALDNAPRGESFAEDFLRQGPAARRNDIAGTTQLLAQGSEVSRCRIAAAANAAEA